MHTTHSSRRLLLPLLLVLLTACNSVPTPATSEAPDTSTTPTTSASATPDTSASATPDTSASATPVAQDAAAPPTATYELIVLPTEEPLIPITPLPTLDVQLGLTPGPPIERATDTPAAEDDASRLAPPGWQIVVRGDLNNDEQRDVLTYRAADVVPAESMQSYLDDYPAIAAEIAIVQESSDGTPQTMLQIDFRGIQSNGTYLSTYSIDNPELTPAAFLMQPDSTNAVLMAIPINAAGEGIAQGFGIFWDTDQNAYRLLGPGGIRVPQTPAPTS